MWTPLFVSSAASRATAIVIVAVLFAFPRQAQPVVEYLGNEGVHVELGDVSILIDALWDDDRGLYERVPPNLLGELTRANGRFRDVDIFLVSHRHGDHFSADMVAGYLKRNAGCTFISSREVVDLLRRSTEWKPALEERVIEVDVELGESLRVLNLENGTIDATWVLHTHARNRDVVNLAFRVEANGESIVHTGDADTAAAADFLSGTSADLALVAFWQFLDDDGGTPLARFPNVKRFAAIHVPTDLGEYEQPLAATKGLIVLEEPGEIAGR